jgi:hypothetical protein
MEFKSEIKNDETYAVNEFVNQLRSKGYEFEIKDVEKHFLSGKRQILKLKDDQIDIYLYSNSEDMENDSNRVDSGGCSYSAAEEGKSVEISWASYPHFYKKGNIIVQYVGENKKIISDLKDALGGQFAGY